MHFYNRYICEGVDLGIYLLLTGEWFQYSPVWIYYIVHVSCVSFVTYQTRPAPVINMVCLCVLYLHLKDTSPAPSRLLRARPVKLG